MNEQQDITTMFDGIAPHYDLLNRLLSLHLDTRWRRKLSHIITNSHPSTILDLATGTADLAIQMALDNPMAAVTGADLSQAMLDIGQKKIAKMQLQHRIQLIQADARRLPFPDHGFDAVTAAFGIRNFRNPDDGLDEMQRVVKPGGIIGILEFTTPTTFPVKPLFHCYAKHLLPRIGRIVSNHPTAYSYLPASINAFSANNDLVKMMQERGWKNVNTHTLCGGIATIYHAKA